MTMTPQDIQSQQFHVRFRGFDVEEVDAFLERIAEEFLVMIEENKELTEQVETLKKEIDSYHHQEKSFQSAILSAQQIAEEMKIKSGREAEEVIAAAKEQARQLQEEASAEIVGLEAEVDRLKQMKQQVAQELRLILQGYLTQLEEMGEGTSAPAAVEEEIPSPPENEPPTPPEEPDAAEVREEPVVDLSDLYEKIEVTDDELATMSESREESNQDGDEDAAGLFAAEVAEETKGSAIPDLEGDMLFTLEDPLDEGPSVSFDEEADEEQEKGEE